VPLVIVNSLLSILIFIIVNPWLCAIAKMDSLIAGLDLPVVPLSEQQQKELDEQRALQQQKIKDIKAQLDALR
jgi:hypothetical protein